MNRRTGLLHLQLGQEIIYLLLAASLASALILAIIAAQQASRIAQLEAVKRRDQPPIITLSEARGYFFPSGRAEISPTFRAQIAKTVVPMIAAYRRDYGVTVIEIVGHTDEQPVGVSVSTLDADLLPLMAGDAGASQIIASAADNVGLGMLRAAAVSRELRSDSRIAGMIVLPLSAGQSTEVSDVLAEPGGAIADRERRRIEIRMRRRN